MAETIEEFIGRKLLVPIAAVGAVVLFIGKVLGWIWGVILSFGVPILCITGILFLCFWVIMFFSMRKRKYGEVGGCLVLVFISGGVFSAVLAGGYHEKFPWAQRIVDTIGWAGEHPVLFGIGVVIVPILAGFLSTLWTGPLPNNGDQCSSCETEDEARLHQEDENSSND